MVTQFLLAFLIALVFPINIGMVCALAVLSTIPRSAAARWAISAGGALGVAIIWLSLFQDPNSSSADFVLAFVATMLAAFLEIALMTWVLRHKVGWDTPFFEERS